MGKAAQLGLLLWKNWLVQKRKVVVTVFEILLPTFFSLILIFIRQRVQNTRYDSPTAWPSFPVNHLNQSLQVCMPNCKLYYAPSSSQTASDIMNRAQAIIGNISAVVGFPDEQSMVNNLLGKIQGQALNSSLVKIDDTLAGVYFSSVPADLSMSANVQYKLRFPNTLRTSSGANKNPFSTVTGWQTDLSVPVFSTLGPRNNGSNTGGPPAYVEENFLTLQYGVDLAIMNAVLNSGNSENETSFSFGNSPWQMAMRRSPYPPYLLDNFVQVIQQELPLLIMLSFVFYAMQIVKDLVHEKENKLKESMKMMGLSGWLHWIAWFIKYFIFLFISVVIETIFFKIHVGKNGSVIGNTNGGVLFIFLLSYAIATIMFCFMLSTFFSKANSAAAAGGILFFVTYIPYFFIQPRYDSMSLGAKVACCLISNVGMALGGQVIGMFEGIGAGVQWYNINKGVSVDDNFSMSDVILMLLLDAVIYGLVAWYVEAVFPGEFGIPQPFYFPFTKSYWIGTSSSAKTRNMAIPGNGQTNDGFTGSGSEENLERSNRNSSQTNHAEFFEPDPTGLRAGIRIQNLRKEFTVNSKKKIAVNDMSLNMYEGQITALLGHNGAGKTTTMSILTGFLPPTSGTAMVNGFDILKDLSGVRSSLGLCPQHNVLFDTLTVEEHLIFFTKLKGFPSDQISSEVDRMIEDTGLRDKRHAQSSTLSGGMKRKLSVGIALTANSKVVILDEPTSGMDPNARRQIWDLLQHHRTDRTMVLSTHFMDEADLLGDRIAIMANGVVQCSGSSLFLKNRYGAGYHMVIVKEPGCEVEPISKLVSTHVPDSRLESNVSAELSYVLPRESKANFEALFTAIDTNKEALKIASYGASVTTMEEVFLRVGKVSEEADPDDDPHDPHPTNGDLPTTKVGDQLANGVYANGHSSYEITAKTSQMKNSGWRLYLQQFYGMFVKRRIHTMRNWILSLAQVLIPLIFTIVALIVINTLPKPKDLPPLSLNLAKFTDMVAAFGVDSPTPSANQVLLSSSYAAGFQTFPTVTTTYVNNASAYASNPNVTQYLVDAGNASISKYNAHYLLALDVTSPSAATVYFSNEALHASAISLNAYDNALFRYVTGRSDANITTINHPLPRTVQDQISDGSLQILVPFTIAFLTLFGMAFLSSSFALFLIKERSTKSKHSQFVSGVHAVTFWASTLVWDYINYLVPAICIVIAFAAFSFDPFIGGGRWGDILLLYLMYGWGMLPFMYLWSFVFDVPSSGLVWLTIFNILSGIGTILAVAILSFPALGTQDVANILEWIFLIILPNFCLGQGLEDFYANNQNLGLCNNAQVPQICQAYRGTNKTNPCCKDNCGTNCLKYQTNYLAVGDGGIGRMLIFLGIQGFVYFFIVFLIEFKVFTKLEYCLGSCTGSQVDPEEHQRQSASLEDSDVSEERKRLTNTSLSVLMKENSLIMSELTKRYDSGLLAVDRLSVGIPAGECFGLLGINGAGKTSTFQMLTGDSFITAGTAYLDGYDIKTNLREVQQRIGYCPQFDAVIDQMTVTETLYMYGRLRGVKEQDLKQASRDLIDTLSLTPHADKLVKSCSGGNKRKLSTAVALIGDPQVIFLDEPSTGVDPVARRHLWTVLSKVRASGKTLVLTSHSMEECDALCTKIAIMVNGQFKCLGGPQHLKNKFGEGYTLIVKIATAPGEPSPNNRPVQEYVESTFPGSILKDEHQGLLHYQVTDPTVTLGRLFGTMEAVRERLNVEDYSVSQTTLEQVFINFARAQVAPREESKGCCSCLPKSLRC